LISKFALVIANTEDQDASFAKLTAPGGDAEEFAQVLQDPICSRNSSHGHGSSTNHRVIHGLDYDKKSG
jgi:hypothetical protein